MDHLRKVTLEAVAYPLHKLGNEYLKSVQRDADPFFESLTILAQCQKLEAIELNCFEYRRIFGDCSDSLCALAERSAIVLKRMIQNGPFRELRLNGPDPRFSEENQVRYWAE